MMNDPNDNMQPQAVYQAASTAPGASLSSRPGSALYMDWQAVRAAKDQLTSLTYEPKPIDKTRGNGLVAQTSLQGGDVIFHVDEPFVLIPSEEYMFESCYHCLRMDASEPVRISLKRCGGCHIVKYCSKACQAASWKHIHSKECAIFQMVNSRAPSGPGTVLATPVRALIQLLLRHQLEPQLCQLMLSGSSNHRSDFKKASVWADIELQATFAVNYCKLPAHFIDLGITMMCVIKVNSFEATEANGWPLGLCFDPLLASANHSCVPNAQISFNNRCASLRALRPIASGEEITISYIDVNRPLATRQAELKRSWFFDCKCPRCLGDWNEYMAFLNSPCRADDQTAMFTDIGALEKHASRVSRVFHSRFADSGEFLGSLMEEFSKAKHKAYKDIFSTMSSFLERLDFLHDRDTIALAPYAGVLVDLALVYRYAGEFEASVIVQLVYAYHVCPYVYPEPWHPARVGRLFHLANTLGELVYGSASLMDLMVLENVAEAREDFFPPLYTLLLLIKDLCPRSHGNSSSSVLHSQVSAILRFLDEQPNANHADIITMTSHGIKDGDGLTIARENFQRLEALADVGLMSAVLGTVDCAGGGHVRKGAPRNLPTGTGSNALCRPPCATTRRMPLK